MMSFCQSPVAYRLKVKPETLHRLFWITAGTCESLILIACRLHEACLESFLGCYAMQHIWGFFFFLLEPVISSLSVSFSFFLLSFFHTPPPPTPLHLRHLSHDGCFSRPSARLCPLTPERPGPYRTHWKDSLEMDVGHVSV